MAALVLGACSFGGGSNNSQAPTAAPSASPSGQAPLVVSEAEAREVLASYDRENNAANADMDRDRIAGIEAGDLLETSLASYRVRGLRPDREPYKPFTHNDPTFWIPRGHGYPRAFVIVSNTGSREGHSVMYFARESPQAPWKAIVSAWVRVGDPPATASADPARDALPKLEPVARDAGGGALLADPGDPARSACARYAAYMSVPDTGAAPEDGRFAPGAHTTVLRQEIIGDRDARIRRSVTVTARENRIAPVFRTAAGSSLVPCVLNEVVDTAVADPVVKLNADGPDLVALLGRTKSFASIRLEYVASVLVSVPEAPDAPITVVNGGLGSSHLVNATGT
ncbi:hypothetical protein OG948_59795 (plasmid) [Embleya sp. NBC_00888]|uniref:hypothetical protein n=1 Tax=Embleya sp. NBC_00888 TaxID=2975960 RepID=UPI002F9171DE|nr:hypothetical protein OG948_59795 [Embleya sp. NBC_00888]